MLSNCNFILLWVTLFFIWENENSYILIKYYKMYLFRDWVLPCRRAKSRLAAARRTVGKGGDRVGRYRNGGARIAQKEQSTQG